PEREARKEAWRSNPSRLEAPCGQSILQERPLGGSPGRRSDSAAPSAPEESDNGVSRCPRRRSSARKDSETPMSAEIVLKIGLRVVKGNLVLLQQGVALEPRLQAEEASHLRLGQGPRAVALPRDGLQGVARHVRPAALEGFGDVFRQAEGDFHSAKLHDRLDSRLHQNWIRPAGTGI